MVEEGLKEKDFMAKKRVSGASVLNGRPMRATKSRRVLVLGQARRHDWQVGRGRPSIPRTHRSYLGP